jgi:hypothetical protein
MVNDMIDDMRFFEGNDGVYVPMRLVEDCTGLGERDTSDLRPEFDSRCVRLFTLFTWPFLAHQRICREHVFALSIMSTEISVREMPINTTTGAFKSQELNKKYIRSSASRTRTCRRSLHHCPYFRRTLKI